VVSRLAPRVLVAFVTSRVRLVRSCSATFRRCRKSAAADAPGNGASVRNAPGTTRYRAAASAARCARVPVSRPRLIPNKKLLRRLLSRTADDAEPPFCAINRSAG
jgi:hypothetical protein